VQYGVLQPKKPKGKELTRAEKRNNRKLSRMRITVEHALSGVKRCRCVKDTLRNTRENCSDDFMVNSTGLHNPRVGQRKRPLRR
jgi:hypothetical protein